MDLKNIYIGHRFRRSICDVILISLLTRYPPMNMQIRYTTPPARIEIFHPCAAPRLRIAVTSAVTREETFEFEDEEYYYYVRAIPKVTVEEEEFNVTQITVPSHRFSLKRKEHKEQDKEKGEEI